MGKRLKLTLFCAARIYRGTGSPFRALRFCTRSLAHWRATTDWLLYLAQHPVLSKAPVFVQRVLSDKIHRPFARCGLSIAERGDLLRNHYETIGPFFPPGVLLSLVSGERLVLAELTSPKDGKNYVFTLSRDMLSQHQGELTLLFTDTATDSHLARLVANMLTDPNGCRVFMIAGMQGPGAAYKDEIVHVTRALNGLRPKRAVLEAASALAVFLGAEKLIATSKKNHVSQSKRKWQRKVVADYDNFLQELAVETLPNGDYSLPIRLPQKNPDDVAPKKRKDCLRRHVLLDSIFDGALNTLRQLKK